MHIVLFEVALSGHHANYLSRLATLFLGQGHRVTATLLERYCKDPAIEKLLHDFPDRFKLMDLKENMLVRRLTAKFGVFGSEIKHWFLFKDTFKKLQSMEPVDYVFFPYLDYCLHATALLGSPTAETPWAGICMRPSFHHIKVGVKAPVPKWRSIKERLFFKLLKLPELRAVYTIDELLPPYIDKFDPLIIQRLQYLPDPAELPNNYNQATARASLNLSAEEFVILVYGAIDERKGIHFLLNAVKGQIFAKPLRLLVAGKHTPAMSQYLGQEPLVTSIDQYVDGDVEEAVFRAADVVWLGYQGHYAMSGVLILSAVAGKSIIATQDGLIGWMTEKYGVGTTIDCNNSNAVNQSIRQCIKKMNALKLENAIELRNLHTWSRFTEIITRHIQS